MTALTQPCPVGGRHAIERDDDWDDRLYCWKCGGWWDVATLPVEVLNALDPP